ncbi:cytochrome P450 [Mycobacterium numidiamassiliense]|uniref:cytochrome P450 n=1 Tax=Mycobacterium numidiamassiliense TaxID=1841861 RepID=UPI000D3E0032|nr:cytochrome P450 [Mycobacterium numidiamassiliense]
MATSVQLPQLPFRHTHPLETAPALRQLRSLGTVHRVRTPVGHEAWLITGYAQVRELLDDPRLGRSHPRPETAARSGESALFGGPLGDFDTETADHTRMRALLQPHFSPRHLRGLAPRVEALTAGLLDDLDEAGSPADLHAALALPLPILVICELLGVPYADRDQFRQWTDDTANVCDRARSERGLAELYRYGLELVKHKRAHPGDDVMSRLCATDGVSDEEAATRSMHLLFAGHETTVVQIGWGVLLLLSNPVRWQELSDNPELIPHAVEELLRASTRGGAGVAGIPRYARADFRIEGVTIRAGDLVLLDIGSANHDPAAFAEPDAVDLGRAQTAHLTFGYGARYCLGAPLARIELKTVFAQLIPRFPSMRLAVDCATLTARDDVLAGGLGELPVTW